MQVKPNRTRCYVCTLDVNSTVDMEILTAIRKSISASNAHAPRVYTKYGSSYIAKKRVTIKGRKAIQKHLVNVGGFYGKPNLRWRSHTRFGDIVGGIANASELDVYIHDDRKNWESNRANH